MPEEEQKTEGKEIGKVTHFFGHLSVAIVELKGNLKVGDTIHIKGATSDVTQAVDSIQVEHEKIEEAKAGDSVGLKVQDKVREQDIVYKV